MSVRMPRTMDPSSRISPAARIPHSGCYDAVGKDGKIRWRCAVNVRRAESDLRAVDSVKLQAMLPGRVVTGAQAIREWRGEIRREVPLWPWLLAAAAWVYLTEGWVAGRAARRRVAAADGTTPLTDKPRFRARMMGRMAGT